jgi:hypothetical protein
MGHEAMPSFLDANTRWQGISGPTDEVVILRVRPDPEPDDVVPIFHGERSVMEPDPSRPEASDLPEMERGMPRVLTEQGEA